MTTITYTGTQSAVGQVITNNNSDLLYFLQSSTAGNALVTNNLGGGTYFYDTANGGTSQINNNGGATYFSDAATAAQAKLTTSANGILDFRSGSSAAQAAITNGSSGTTYFEDTSTAASAAIANTAGGSTHFYNSSRGGTAQFSNNGGTTYFSNSATADHATVTTSNNGYVDFTSSSTADHATITNGSAGTTYFQDTSTAAGAAITNSVGGSVHFYDSSNGGTAQIGNNGGTTYFSNSSTADHATLLTSNNGYIDFTDSSTAANAIITNASDGTTYFDTASSAGNATIKNTAGATYFQGATTASHATITNTGEGFVDFLGTSTAANATILNDASALPVGGSGSFTDFENSSTAGNSVITSINGGRVVFYDNSTGGNAQLITNGSTSSVEFSLTTGLAGDHKVSAGSISGSGTIYLGASALTVGSLGLNDLVSGQIVDGGRGGGSGASLLKAGTGVLNLSGNNTYSGGTTLLAGTLDLASVAAAGTGGLTFTTGAQKLVLESAALKADAQHSLANTISNFAVDGDTIDVRGVGTATASFDTSSGLLTLTTAGQTAATLKFSGSFAGQQFQTGSDGQGGTNVTLVPYSAPTYSIAVNRASGAEGNTAGQGTAFTYTVTRTGSLGAAGSVAVGLSGTATNNSDYTVVGLSNNAVSFAAGASTASFTVTSTPDTVVEGDETVVAKLGAITGGGTLGTNSSATATILNDDTTTIKSLALASASDVVTSGSKAKAEPTNSSVHGESQQQHNASGTLFTDVSALINGTHHETSLHSGETLTGHGDKADVFAFPAVFDHETVVNFVTGTGPLHDTLELPKGFFANNDFSTGLSTVGGNAVLTGASGDEITLAGVSPNSLATSNFSFV